MSNKLKSCPNYCGLACVDGSCPKTLKYEYPELYDGVVPTCDNCFSYKGCEDCICDDPEIIGFDCECEFKGKYYLTT